MEILLNYKLIGMRIRAIRQKNHYTQEYVAERASISIQHFSGIENGNTKLSLPCLVNICNALDVTPDDLLMDSVNHAKPQLLENVSAVFSDCSNDEIFLMLSQADNLKKMLRIKSKETST